MYSSYLTRCKALIGLAGKKVVLKETRVLMAATQKLTVRGDRTKQVSGTKRVQAEKILFILLADLFYFPFVVFLITCVEIMFKK